LNFRAFRIDWERNARGGEGTASVQPLGGRNLIAAAWFALQHLIDRLAKGGRLVRLTVPVSPRMQRRLKMYIDYRGFVGMARHSFSYFKRRMSFHAAAQPGEDVFPPDSGLSPGTGWRPLEDYRGETFRRARDGAEIIVAASAPGSNELALQVEPPEKTSAGVDLVLMDAAGKTIASQRASGLSFVRFAIDRASGRTQIFRLGVRDASAPASEVKVFWCGFTNRAAGQTVTSSQPWGAGWRWEPETDAMLATGPAELVLRAPSGPARPLFIDL